MKNIIEQIKTAYIKKFKTEKLSDNDIRNMFYTQKLTGIPYMFFNYDTDTVYDNTHWQALRPDYIKNMASEIKTKFDTIPEFKSTYDLAAFAQSVIFIPATVEITNTLVNISEHIKKHHDDEIPLQISKLILRDKQSRKIITPNDMWLVGKDTDVSNRSIEYMYRQTQRNMNYNKMLIQTGVKQR